MLWINALTDCTATAATATACFDAGDLVVAEGAVLETALVECVAQTAAAAAGQRARGGGKSTPGDQGMLVAVSNFKIQSRPAAGELLRIDIQELKRLGGLLLISGLVRCGDRIVASGELSLYA
jgi:hypothetical protein